MPYNAKPDAKPDAMRCDEFVPSLSIERLRRFAILEIVRSISPRDLLVPCSRLILVRAPAWARALPRFIDRFCSVLPPRR